ncbi:MAG TPA: EamA family transporter [Gemmatimonadaceae bacterium]
MTQPRGRILLAFASIYLIWGSTYLFMRFAVETLPPVALAGVRYFVAGAILLAIASWRRIPESRKVPWRGHAVVGTLLTAGNGSVALAVQRIPSGVAALLVALTPCLMVLLEWWWRRGSRPTVGVVSGLVLGVAGMLVLVGPRSLGGEPIDPVGAGIVLFGSAAWAVGSVYSRTLPRFESAMRTSAIQMLAGGAVVTVIALVSGDFGRFDPSMASFKSVFAFAYLILVGSLVGYSSYMYLLGVTSAARASTYAFVNPVVAVFLGAAFANESLSPRVLGAGAIIVLAVALITLFGGERRLPPTRPRAGEGMEVHEAP